MPEDTFIRRRLRWCGAAAAAVGLAMAALAIAGQAPATSAAGAVAGQVSLIDNASGLDRVVVTATGLKAPGIGQVHRVWLVSDDGATGRYLGDVIPDAAGAVAFTWDQPAGENLLAQYSQVAISTESGAAGTKPGGTTVRTGRLDAAALSQVRRLLSRWPDSRYGVATVPGLRRQAQVARDVAWVLREAAVHGDWDTARRKAEQLVNLVEGRRGQFYADHNGDGRIEDPGDGTGFLPYSWAALTQAQFVYATAADEAYAKEAQALQSPVTFALLSAGFVRDTGREVARSKDPYTIEDLAGHLVTATSYILAATDPAGDPDLVAIVDDREMTPVVARAKSLVRFDLTEAGR
ncbi:MAG: hypothetical protein KGS10_15420 [Chloroflexi bacterium]|jgi:hypothetical protein|nr:hypothetical protein [Chloroflexota bacterium]